MFKKISLSVLVVVMVFAVIGCGAKFWKGTDAIVEPARELYEKTTVQVEETFSLLAEADTHYKNVKAVFVNESGGHTAVYETQSETKQVELKAANLFYLEIRSEILDVYAEYIEVKNKAEKGYYDYQKLKDINLKLNAIIKRIPDIIINLKRII